MILPGESPGTLRPFSRWRDGASPCQPPRMSHFRAGRRRLAGSCMVDELRLSPIVQGVEFTVVEQGVRIRALILRDALERHFGADESPSSWLRAYEDHRDTIDCAAADRFRRSGGASVVVLGTDAENDFRRWRRSDVR